MKKIKKTPVFFIATKIKNTPVVVNFYTTKGKKVESESVTKEKTDSGVYYYANI